LLSNHLSQLFCGKLKLIDVIDNTLTGVGRETWLVRENECERPGMDGVEILRAFRHMMLLCGALCRPYP
jgi:hypothetical protein